MDNKIEKFLRDICLDANHEIPYITRCNALNLLFHSIINLVDIGGIDVTPNQAYELLLVYIEKGKIRALKRLQSYCPGSLGLVEAKHAIDKWIEDNNIIRVAPRTAN
jgi:hypothetical protein